MTQSISSYETGNANVRKLEQWIKVTPLSMVPLNQFGTADRKAVSTNVGFSRSTIGSNKKLAALFSELDSRLVTLAKTELDRLPNSEGDIRETLQELASRLAVMAVQQEALQYKLARLEYLESTGVSID